MTCSASRQNGCLWISVTGQLDSSNAAEIREQCIGHISESESEVVVDLTDLEYIDRTGLDVLLVVYRSLESMGRKLSILNLHGQPKEAFEGLQSAYTIECVTDLSPRVLPRLVGATA